MKARLYHHEESTNTNEFACLKGNDVITAKVSDHHPIIHDGVLFWNVMMQGKKRNGRTGISYNNGFGIEETEQQYISRLIKISHVIAEIIYRDPSIEVISLCEGPIQPLHVNLFLKSLKKYPLMDKFFKNSKSEFHKPDIKNFPNWGLLMLVDKNYKVSDLKCEAMENSIIYNKLANRFHLWKLTQNNGNNKFLALGHFPFGGDEHITERQNLSVYGNMYCDLVKNLLNKYANDQFILCADFNLNPYLISEWKDRAMDQITYNNSILLTKEEKSNASIINTVTVDGILLSMQEKQKYYSLRYNPGLFSRLCLEDTLFESSLPKHRVSI